RCRWCRPLARAPAALSFATARQQPSWCPPSNDPPLLVEKSPLRLRRFCPMTRSTWGARRAARALSVVGFGVMAAAPLGAQASSQPEPAPRAPLDVKPGSITYDDVPYPHPVAYLPLTVYGQDVRMAYMDVPPAGPPNGRTVVLLHGMNFGGFYFGGPIDALRKEGFRVVVPDQIGFGRSSKPIIPYNFHDMALN